MSNSLQNNGIVTLMNPTNDNNDDNNNNKNSNNDNNDNDEDRKFLRAAAEAIVATSMNNEIDPTILELLKRIQYANSSSTSYNNVNILNNHQSQNLHNNSGGFNHITGNQGIDLNFLAAGTNTKTNTNVNTNQQGFSFLNQSVSQNSNVSSTNHFPLFNLNYFDSLDSKVSNNENNNNKTVHSASDNSKIVSQIPPTPNLWNFNSVMSSDLYTSSGTTLKSHNNSPMNSSQFPTTSKASNNQDSQSASSSQPTTPRSSSSSSNLTMQEGEKPFLCVDCPLSFRRSSDLRRHQRAHMPVLPHICQLCGKGFARKDALKRHVDTLTCKRNRERLINSGGKPPNVKPLGLAGEDN